ncbi:MAG: glycogen-binding domain-containing protein [Candidatus Omnitrophica bacterium]|nr:glycogen-binding domain-containing protein [Candidatus Omnitrophota bacterium]
MPRTKKTKTAVFTLYAPEAKKVYIAGSFNNWNPKKLPAKKDTKGNWSAKVSLQPGTYEYKFVVDDNWIPDPNCARNIPNPFGSLNSILEVK